MSSPALVVFDAETVWTDDYSITKMTTAEYILDRRFGLLGFGLCVNNKPAHYFHGEASLLKIKKQLENSVIICHNAHFDAAILTWHYDIKPLGWICTMQMARALGHNVEVGGSLKKLALQYGLGDKPELTPNASPEELEARGWWDADATRKLFHIFAPRLPHDEFKLIDMTIRQFTESVVEADVEKLTKLSKERKAQRLASLKEAGVDDPKEVGSSTRMVEILEKLGVEVPYKPSPSVKDKWIPAFAKTDDGMQELLEHDDPRVQAVAEARVLVRGSTDDTRADTYVALAQYGALPIFYKYWGTHPGRWSGGDGTNFANLKRRGVLRDCLLAPAGHVFVEADMKQIQARLAAMLAGQDDLLADFAAGRDVYCDFGNDLFHRPITKADEFERFCSKFWVLGGWFGMGGATGARQMKAKINGEKHPFIAPTEDEATQHVRALRARYYKMEPLWDEMERMLASPGRTVGPLTMGDDRVLLPNGMAIYYHGLRWEKYTDWQNKTKHGWRYTGREGRTALWGGTATQNACLALERTLLAAAMVELMPYWRISLHTYDSLVLCVKENQVESARAALSHVLTKKRSWCPTLPLGVDIGVGRTYGECGNK